jgi:hypothetical protein
VLEHEIINCPDGFAEEDNDSFTTMLQEEQGKHSGNHPRDDLD